MQIENFIKMLTEKTTPIFSVSEITASVKQLIETRLAPCWVEGEISNWVHHSSGHCYFSLKDATCQIRAVLWRSYRAGLKFDPEDGMKVLAYGSLKVYEKAGTYQINVFTLKPSGQGAAQLAFEQLKNKLQAEGLFAPQRKRPIPTDVTTVGIVTSPTGAAIRDTVHILQRRAPSTHIILYPVPVQGDGAAEAIARGIDDFNLFGKVDVLIVGRGGGSAEDLAAFNTEIVARAIANSKIPVISAVGHEIDFTIADFVADLRAPTPSAAAELAVTDQSQQQNALCSLVERFDFAWSAYFERLKERLGYLQSALRAHSPQDQVFQAMQRLDEMDRSLHLLVRHRVDQARMDFGRLAGKLEALSPLGVLARGFSVLRKPQNRQIVRSVSQVALGERIEGFLADGKIEMRVERIEENARGKMEMQNREPEYGAERDEGSLRGMT